MKHGRSVAVQLTLAAEVGLEVFFSCLSTNEGKKFVEYILIVETSQALLFLMGSTVFVTAVHILSSKQITCIT
jgi:hypothetical protein